MSMKVAIDEIPGHLEERGAAAFVMTVGASGLPKIHHGFVSSEGPVLIAAVGAGSAKNGLERPAVTLMWPATEADGSDMHLLVDGEVVAADPDGEQPTITIKPTSAIRHRIAGSDHAC